jgi:DNA processing protein
MVSVKKYDMDIKTVILRIDNSRYPRLLREIPDPPPVLYVRGSGSKINLEKTIAVVGTRHPTPYGIAITKKLVSDLVGQGFTIVSGLALGIDAVAHWAAIASAGKTIAVLGCGIDIIAPPSNATLYWDIVHGHGAVVSEIPPGVRTDKKRFVTRNRIISGLSLGVVVVEGSEHSGTLITAKYAADQGREVFAVPGLVTSKYSRASSILLKNGAKLVESADDIIEEL